MPMNTSIPLQVQSPQIENPQNAMLRALQMQGAMQQQESSAFDMDLKRKGVERQNRMDQILGAGGDSSALRRGGFLKESLELDKATLDADETKAKTRKHTAEAGKIDYEKELKNVEHIASVLSLARDPQSYMTVRQVLANRAGPKQAEFLAQFPEQFDPAFVQAKIAEGQTITQRLADERAREQNAETKRSNVTRETETARSHRANEQTAAGHLGVAQAQLGVARGNLGVSQERLGLERAAAGGDQTRGGPVLGVPAPTVLPWSNQTLPKDANKVKAKEQERGAKELEKDADAARAAEAAAKEAARFVELNKKTGTGGLVDRIGPTRWAQGVGNDYSEMEGITARLAPAMRQPGSGASSDYDGKQFERATVGVDKPSQTNANIAAGLKERAKQLQEYTEFRQTYLEQNGTLQGADRYWKDYVNKNPIFSTEGKNFELNPKRQGWVDHFRSQTQKPASAPAAAPKPGGSPRVVDFSSLPGGY